jgi:hypothetical protein
VYEWRGPDVLEGETLLSRFQGSAANQIGQVRNESDFVEPVVEVLPKRKTKFAARLLQSGERVLTASTGFAAGSPAYLACFHILADGVFAQVIMQRNFWVSQHQQKLGLVVVNSLERVV